MKHCKQELLNCTGELRNTGQEVGDKNILICEHLTLDKVQEVISSWEKMTLSWSALNHIDQNRHLTDLGFNLARLVEIVKIKLLDLRIELVSEYFNFEEIDTCSLLSTRYFEFEPKPEQACSDMNTSVVLIAKWSIKLKCSGSDKSRAFLRLLYNNGFYRYN